MDERTSLGEPSDSRHSQDVAWVDGAPHFKSLPYCSLLLRPSCQIAGRGAGYGYFVPPVYGSVDQITDADGDARCRRLRDDQDTTGPW